MSLLPEFEYKRPETLGELLVILEDYKGKAILLAGGTDLIPRLKLGLKQPALVVDIKGLAEDLHSIAPDGKRVKIGSLTTIDEIARSTLIGNNFPGLHKAALSTASEIIQYGGTIGGNLSIIPLSALLFPSMKWAREVWSSVRAGRGLEGTNFRLSMN